MKKQAVKIKGSPVWKRRIAAAALIAGTLVFLYWFSGRPREYTVTLQNGGFNPKELRVTQGSTVIFRTSAGQSFWPASNFHPSHGLYPQFDAARPIAPDATWRFRFDVPGVWRFHDHLHSQYTGVVVVTNKPFAWFTGNPCDAAHLKTADAQVKERCYIQQVETVLRKQGIDAAFDTLSAIYDAHPEFSFSCHDVTHLLGEAAYREYLEKKTVVTTPKTSFCGYGFYHGFIEALLFTTGSFDHATEYCTAMNAALSKNMDSSQALDACFHGFGHGAFDTLSIQYWGNDQRMVDTSLATCERVIASSEPHKRVQCASGVFNGLGNAYSNDRYYLKFNAEDPVGMCRRLTTEAYKTSCFTEVGIAYVNTNKFNRAHAVPWILSETDPIGRREMISGYVSDQVRRGIDADNPSGYHALCTSLGSAELEQSCIEGIVVGAYVWGKPGQQQDAAFRFCSTFGAGSPSHEFCIQNTVTRLGLVFPTEQLRAYCRTLDVSYQHYCGVKL